MVDPLKDKPRLESDAMGPCLRCDRPMLKTELPMFYRIDISTCGIDGNEVRRHVGLAQSIAPGEAGLALAAVLGPGVKPIIVMDRQEGLNICHSCAIEGQLTLLELFALTEKSKEDEADG